MVDSLADRYAREGKPVVFLEHNLDALNSFQNRRKNMWYAARNGGNTAQTPLVMVDSGFRWSEGNVNFEREYSRIVDEALARPPEIDLSAYYERSGGVYDLRVSVTNWDDAPLTGASLHAILFDDSQVLHTHHSVRSMSSGAIGQALAYGQTGSFQIQLTAPTGLDAEQRAHAQVVVLVDRAAGDRPGFDALQAALAREGAPPTPTDEPSATPTDPPTPTEAPTDPPIPTDPPEPTPTLEPVGPASRVFMPILGRRWAP